MGKLALEKMLIALWNSRQFNSMVFRGKGVSLTEIQKQFSAMENDYCRMRLSYPNEKKMYYFQSGKREVI